MGHCDRLRSSKFPSSLELARSTCAEDPLRCTNSTREIRGLSTSVTKEQHQSQQTRISSNSTDLTHDPSRFATLIQRHFVNWTVTRNQHSTCKFSRSTIKSSPGTRFQTLLHSWDPCLIKLTESHSKVPQKSSRGIC